MKTIIGLFDSVNEAQAARRDLIGSGIEQDRISLVTRPAGDTIFPHDRAGPGESAGIGATAGAIAGGAAGLLATLVPFMIPGVGPLLAAGSIITVLTGAGIGAAAGGIMGALTGLDIPEHEAEVYAEGLERGGTLLAVDASDHDADRIAAVLTQHHAVDIEKRAMDWEARGWQRQYPAPREEETESKREIDAKNRGVERPGDAESPKRAASSKDRAGSEKNSLARKRKA